MTKDFSPESKPSNVDVYIAKCPEDIQGKLKEIRAAIKEAAPDARKRQVNFLMPGYSYLGYDYNGMFACRDTGGKSYPLVEYSKSILFDLITIVARLVEGFASLEWRQDKTRQYGPFALKL